MIINIFVFCVTGWRDIILFMNNAKGGDRMVVSSTEVQNDFGRYVDLAAEHEIIITRDGLPVAKLLGVKKNGPYLSDRLVGLVPADVDERLLKAERVARH